ncbi:MAG: hypothetical protein LBU43_03915 [Candidatus Accumulibacter sp.]|jgi:hypothetical protein|nr:hypothetical protein [Accumulibacter sp.]
MANTIQANYDLTRGIQDILPFEAGSLPAKAALAPTDVSRAALLDTLYAARNCAAVIGSFLSPTVRNLENLSPERYRRSLRQCREQLKNSDDPALAALAELLQEDGERVDLLQSFQGLLLAG